jgi:uncharacterized protein YutE (UPF0331/DUF86 family)
MTDRDLVAKKLARIVTCLHELRTLAAVHRIHDDVREERFVEHTLQIAIQSALDVASHIASDDRLGEPETNRALFQLLARAGVVSDDLAQRLAEMAGFRNVLVHGYDDVQIQIVEDVVLNHLGDLDEFVAAVKRRVERIEG